MFHQAQQKRIFQDVIYQIEEAIFSGNLKAGEKLPPERKLKEMFQTSRGTLREALRVLEHKGLLKMTTGVNGGATVIKVTTHKISESFSLLIRSQNVSLHNLSEFREGVEGIVTALASQRAKKSDIDFLKDILKRAGTYCKKGVSHWKEIIQADNEFHMFLAHISNNVLYESILKTIHENVNRYYNRFLPKNETVMQQNHLDLMEILQVVESKNADESRILAQSHVRRFTAFMI